METGVVTSVASEHSGEFTVTCISRSGTKNIKVIDSETSRWMGLSSRLGQWVSLKMYWNGVWTASPVFTVLPTSVIRTAYETFVQIMVVCRSQPLRVNGVATWWCDGIGQIADINGIINDKSAQMGRLCRLWISRPANRQFTWIVASEQYPRDIRWADGVDHFGLITLTKILDARDVIFDSAEEARKKKYVSTLINPRRNNLRSDGREIRRNFALERVNFRCVSTALPSSNYGDATVAISDLTCGLKSAGVLDGQYTTSDDDTDTESQCNSDSDASAEDCDDDIDDCPDLSGLCAIEKLQDDICHLTAIRMERKFRMNDDDDEMDVHPALRGLRAIEKVHDTICHLTATRNERKLRKNDDDGLSAIETFQDTICTVTEHIIERRYLKKRY